MLGANSLECYKARPDPCYNEEHRHSAIGFVTPAQRNAGLDTALLHQRVEVYAAAKKRHPTRWSGATRNWARIHVVHLNPEQPLAEKGLKRRKI